MTTLPKFAAFSILAISVLSTLSTANAAGESPEAPTRDPSAYPIEVEPHLSFGVANVYGATGFGAGLRVSIPIIPSLLPSVPDNLALSVGGDILHYENCYFSSRCGADYLMLPVAAQWNIFVARRVSLLAEGGVFVYKGFFGACGSGDGAGCSAPSSFGILPTIAIGGRVHVSDGVAFTVRIGYPTITLGASFM